MLGKYFILSLVAAGIASAAAAPAPATSTKCAAQAILDKCIADMTKISEGCDPVNYKCLCQTNKDILTCYNNCPNDPQRDIQGSKVTAWCVAAGGDATSTPVATTTTQAAASSTAASTSSVAVGTDTATGVTVILTATGSSGSTKSATATGTKSSSTPTPSAGAGSAIRPAGFAAGALAAAAWLL